MNWSKTCFKVSRVRASALFSITLFITMSVAQSAKDKGSPDANGAAKGKPSPTPTPAPTPAPPVDTKCYIGSGCIDATFGSNGVRLLPGETMEGAELQPDGKIVAVGLGPGTAGLADAIILRLNPDGTLDDSFGTVDPQNPLLRLGYKYDDIDLLSNRALELVIQPDGRIVVGGTRVDAGSVLWTIVRYEANGERDITFGNNGVVRSSISTIFEGLALQSDGRIIAAGGDWVARFNQDGSPDTTFGTGGTGMINLRPMISSYSVAIQVVQGQERIVLGGYQNITSTGKGRKINHNEFSIVRLLPTGQLDSSFGSGGKVNTSFGYTDVLQEIAIDSNNRIVASGIVGTAGPQATGVARYSENGALDPTFGGGTGKVSTMVNGYRTTSYDVLLQPDGKIISVGYAESATAGTNLTLIRYNSDGTQDASFGPGTFGPGIAVADISGTTDFGLTGIILQDGGIAAGGYANATSFFTRYIP